MSVNDTVLPVLLVCASNLMHIVDICEWYFIPSFTGLCFKPDAHSWYLWMLLYSQINWSVFYLKHIVDVCEWYCIPSLTGLCFNPDAHSWCLWMIQYSQFYWHQSHWSWCIIINDPHFPTHCSTVSPVLLVVIYQWYALSYPLFYSVTSLTGRVVLLAHTKIL